MRARAYRTISIFRRACFVNFLFRARQPRPARVGWNHHQSGARGARPDPEGDLMNSNAFALASHTFANGTSARYDTRAFDLSMYDESDAIMMAHTSREDASGKGAAPRYSSVSALLGAVSGRCSAPTPSRPPYPLAFRVLRVLLVFPSCLPFAGVPI